MSQLPCKRFWEGPVGITLMPRKQQSGAYFWTFAFTRAFKRQGRESWEYTEFFGQKHAAALGKIMSRAMQFMEQNEPGRFTEDWMAEQDDDGRKPRRDPHGNGLDDVQLPPLRAAAG